MTLKVEEGKAIINKLKQIRNACIKCKVFGSSNIDYRIKNYKNEYNMIKKDYCDLFDNADKLASITDLDHGVKNKINDICDQIFELEAELIFIFKNYDNQEEKYKQLYFLKIHKISNEYDFDKLSEKVWNLGYNIDKNEFFRNDWIIKVKDNKYKKKFQSIKIYNATLDEELKIEYNAYKDDFKKAEKISVNEEDNFFTLLD